jgi:hypothetical protein
VAEWGERRWDSMACMALWSICVDGSIISAIVHIVCFYIKVDVVVNI